MREYTTNIHLNGEVLVDIDYSTNDFYIGITDSGKIITPYDKFQISHNFSFPIIRQINDESFLIADARKSKGVNNCFVCDLHGNIMEQFSMGDGIEDIEIIKEKIIVTYFDEGVIKGVGGKDPNKEGLAVLDLKGNLLLGYNGKHGGIVILDCYCICKHGTNRVLFLPYTNFPLIELNIDTLEETVYHIPEELKGSNSITSTADSVIFHSPYKDKSGLFKWKIGAQNAERIGEYSAELRGLKNGKFLSIGNKGFTIIDLN
jgi:hypothetical protein